MPRRPPTIPELALAAAEPMVLTPARHLPTGPGWHYEIKHDGYRMLAGTAPGGLKTRNGADATAWFPELVDSLKQLPAGAHILDGEVCVLDDIGRSDFNRLHARALHRGWHRGADPVVLCAFDLLMLAGRDIRMQPIEERRARLRTMLAGITHGLMFVDQVDDGAWLYDQVLALKLEGVVAKRAGSAYIAGRSGDWLKIKRPGAVPPGRFHREV